MNLAWVGMAVMVVVLVFVAGVAYANSYCPNGRPLPWRQLPRNRTFAIWDLINHWAWVYDTETKQPVSISIPLKMVVKLNLKKGSIIEVKDGFGPEPVMMTATPPQYRGIFSLLP